ncbi:MAG: hypothetical protein WDO56_20500 [Gammaproteobacteria bacterium]
MIRIFEAGRCQVGGLHYLYAVMEYADQNLAQLLEHRALADDEAREMLVPTLSALAYLHGRKLMQGRLKPSNVLVVGDQLKLASDTVGAAVDGGESATNDVWALGVTMCEALARRQPSGLDSEAGAVVLPPGLSPAFRELIAWCLSRKPQDRPEVSELQAWLRGEHTARSAGATQQPGAIGPPGSATRDPVVVQSTAPIVAAPKAVVSNRQPAKSHVVPLIIGAVVALALIWVGFRVLRSDRVAVPSQAPTPARAQGEAAPEVIDAPRAEAVAPASATARASGKSTVPPSAVHTEIPDVPRRAQQTIRGTIRVSVRVIVDKGRQGLRSSRGQARSEPVFRAAGHQRREEMDIRAGGHRRPAPAPGAIQLHACGRDSAGRRTSLADRSLMPHVLR